MSLKGSGKGNVPDLEVPELNFEDEGEKKISLKNMKIIKKNTWKCQNKDETSREITTRGNTQIMKKSLKPKIKKIYHEKFLVTKSGSVFSMFKGLIGQKELTDDSMKPILDKYR